MGLWWRAPSYELVDGPKGQIIAPAGRASVVDVDPWDGWSPDESRRRDTSPGTELASLGRYRHELFDDAGRAIPGAVLSEAATEGILAFVEKWGLLGTLLAEITWVRSVDALTWFSGGEWRSRLLRPGEPTTFAVERVTHNGPLVDENTAWWLEHSTARRIFLVFTRHFKETYSEPVREFLINAWRVEQALGALQSGDFFGANLILGKMAAHAAPVINPTENGASQRWACGSLIETIAVQTMMDADQRPMVRCGGCGQWFRLLTAHKTKWCSGRCQKNAPRRTGRPVGRPRKE